MTHVQYLQEQVIKLEEEVKRLRAERDSLTYKLYYHTRKIAETKKPIQPSNPVIIKSTLPIGAGN